MSLFCVIKWFMCVNVESGFLHRPNWHRALNHLSMWLFVDLSMIFYNLMFVIWWLVNDSPYDTVILSFEINWTTVEIWAGGEKQQMFPSNFPSAGCWPAIEIILHCWAAVNACVHQQWVALLIIKAHMRSAILPGINEGYKLSPGGTHQLVQCCASATVMPWDSQWPQQP